MKHYRLSYFIGQAFQGILRNGVMSVASVAVLMSCLIVLCSFALLVVNINVNLNSLGLMNEIVIFLEYDLTEEEIVSIEQQIKSIEYVDVDNVQRITADEGLNIMKEQAGDFGYLYEEYRDDNPLADCFKITYIDAEKVTSISYNLRQIDGVRKTNDQVDLANMITSFKSGIMFIFICFLAVLFVVSIFVIINTVKLSVYSRKDEISVMRYMGATGWFISLPFVLEGAIIGLIASIPAAFIGRALYVYTTETMGATLTMLTFVPLADVVYYLFMGIIATGIVTGVIGSTISLSKYTKN